MLQRCKFGIGSKGQESATYDAPPRPSCCCPCAVAKEHAGGGEERRGTEPRAGGGGGNCCCCCCCCNDVGRVCVCRLVRHLLSHDESCPTFDLPGDAVGHGTKPPLLLLFPPRHPPLGHWARGKKHSWREFQRHGKLLLPRLPMHPRTVCVKVFRDIGDMLFPCS